MGNWWINIVIRKNGPERFLEQEGYIGVCLGRGVAGWGGFGAWEGN